jgi:ABC-2 type transport system ATP-binding protein
LFSRLLAQNVTAAISIQDLRKTYGDLQAVDGVSLDVEQGQFFGLLGPNGAGKTTTINILCGLSNKTSGTAALFGYDVVTQYRQARRQVGLVPQEFNFDQFIKVSRMLDFQGGYYGIPRVVRQERVERLLHDFDLWEKRNQPMRALSGGMKRRAIIARALVHQPPIVILDEPTAGVDVDLRKSMWNYFRKMNEEGTTILLTTHYIEEAEQLCDRIAIINHGKIIAHDSTRGMSERLRRESIVVHVHEALTGEQETALSHFNPGVSDDRLEFTLTFDRQDTRYHDLLEKILATGVRVMNIQPVENRLESVFLELTSEERAS